MASNSQKLSKAQLTAKTKSFEKAVLQLGKKFPELSGNYALTKAKKKAPSTLKSQSTSTKRCLAWGRDPVTGNRICILWG